MHDKSLPLFAFALVGGTPRLGHRICCPTGITLRVVPSPRVAGNGPVRSLVEQIRRGHLDHLLIRTDRIGHSTCHGLRSAARRCRVPVHAVRGGQDRVEALLKAILCEVRHGC